MEDSQLYGHELDGFVQLTAGSANQKAAIIVGLSVATTSPYAIADINVLQTEDGLALQAPTLRSSGTGSGKLCMAVYITIYVKAGVSLTDLEIATQHLNLRLHSSLFNHNGALEVSNSATFTTIRGNVNTGYWSSRNTVIDVISGSVSGTFALRDLLVIKTRSGTIDVDVDPKPADRTAPAPADFTAKTTSGSIAVRFPTSGTSDDIPEREYRTRTETNSGSISGSYILGLTSTFRTTSGSISADVLPYTAAENGASSLRTETGSGHTRIELLSPFQNKGQPMTRLRSLHKSMSSGLSLVYPQEWEGIINGGTLSGRLNIHGKDVEVLKIGETPVGKRIRARKGSDIASNLEVLTTSGSIDVTVGDVF